MNVGRVKIYLRIVCRLLQEMEINMKKRKYIVDSSCDTFVYQGVNIQSAPLVISTEENHWIDDEHMDVHHMLDTLENHKGRSYTACPSAESWLNAFEGGDEIFVATMTSALSGTCNSAIAAREIYLQEHPDAKITVIDTLSTGPELRLVVEKLVELGETDLTFDEVDAQVREYMHQTRLFFALGSLHNMGQNGRVNKVLVSAVGLLGISIIATASEDGKVKPISKCRGEKKIVKHMLEELKAAGYAGGKARISHVENEEIARKLEIAVKEKYGDVDVTVYPAGGLCSYYGERGGILVGCEING